MSLTHEEIKEILKSCMNKTHEEVLQILHTDKGQQLIQDMAKSIFPKDKNATIDENEMANSICNMFDNGNAKTEETRKITKREQKGNNVVDIFNDYTVIDIETTGLDTSWDEIIELSALKVRNNQIVEEYSHLVKPKQSIPCFVTDLTGITDEMVKNEPSIESILPKFIDFLGKDTLIGHNVNFDINFLYDNSMEFLNKPLINNYMDTMRVARKLLPEEKHHRLKDLVKYFSVEKRTEHRALNDCLLTKDVYDKLMSLAIDKYTTKENFIEQVKPKHAPKVKAKDVIAQTDEFDEGHPLYGKVCVFTGVLEKMLRKDAMQIVVNLGGICADKVTTDTNFLILGNTDYCTNIKEGKSNKLKTAERYKLKGQDIEIISENVFYEMIENA